MPEQVLPFELLKDYPGLIHRQPLFERNDLDVESYHLSFLNKHGELLNDDSEIPPFLTQLSQILPAINQHQHALLTMPESWLDALSKDKQAKEKYTFAVSGNAILKAQSEQASSINTATQKYDDNSGKTLLIDVAEFNPAQLTEHLPYWRDNHELLCATNVNGLDQFAFWKQQELDLLQGQFYTLPSEQTHNKMSPSVEILMSLLVKLQDPNITAEEVAATISLDVSLSYKLLRLINSAFFGLKREVSSLKEAIVMLGHNKIKTWGSLLSLSDLDDKPQELRITAMTRAKMCELLAQHYQGTSDSFFSAGLFSSLDALTDKPMTSLVNNLPLSPELNEALLNQTGPMGMALRDVLNYEKGDWQAIQSSQIPLDIMSNAYLDAIHWAKELNTQLKD